MLVAPYKTKKILKASIGQRFMYQETSIFGNEYDPNLQGAAVVGPGAYTRKWYAQVWLRDGTLVKVT